MDKFYILLECKIEFLAAFQSFFNTMDILKQYITPKALVHHHFSSFNDLIYRGLQNIVDREPEIQYPDVHPTFSIKFGHVYVGNPMYTSSDGTTMKLYPNEARKRNINYEGIIYVNINIKNLIAKTTVEHLRIPIGKLPIMVRSCLCNLNAHNIIEREECENDPGGYFILKGKERVLVGQMHPAYNKIFVFPAKPEEKYEYIAEIRSFNSSGESVLIQAKINRADECVFSLPFLKGNIPAGLVFHALNYPIENAQNLAKITNEKIGDILNSQYDEAACPQNAFEKILPFLVEHQSLEYVENIFATKLFYHIGKITPFKCANQLAYILKQLIAVREGSRVCDDKSNLSNKRIDSSGILVAFLFQGLFKQLTKMLKVSLVNKKRLDPINIIKTNLINIISFGLASSFMTGNWGMKSMVYSRVGVSQVLSVQNRGARLSYMRRIMLPNGRKGKSMAARALHASQFSFICPYESPEGETVGFVLNFALTTDITNTIYNHEIFCVIKSCSSFTRNFLESQLIVLNGKLIGSTGNPLEFKRSFNQFRDSAILDDTISFVWLKYMNEIHIESDHGRMIRPLLTLDNPRRLVFRDAFELEQAVVAMEELDLKRNKCDYIEPCPAITMMGVMASVIPFSNHSQSPRNAYQASMGKQAIGIPVESFNYRFDTSLHVMDYIQSPLTRTRVVNVLNFDTNSHGAMPIVAIMTLSGFNQEDSVILNKSSIDRGLFHVTTFKTFVEEEHKHGNSNFEKINLPKYEFRKQDVNYSYLDENGIVSKNDKFWPLKLQREKFWLSVGDAIVGKTIHKTIKQQDGTRKLQIVDNTLVIKSGEEGYLDNILTTTNNEGIRIIKIRIRVPRRPELGDKFASSTAQKGTCGMIYSQEDLPFDKDGIVPDLIMNPHAIPSRMTINMLMEMCFNAKACKIGKIQDSTAFQHSNIEQELADNLKLLGLDSYTTTLYSGTTGNVYPSKIFMAPAFYQRLKHMVSDKIHYRMAGPLDILTHQPVAGRSRDGGLRCGEMEKDATESIGVTRMLKEFMYDQSDKYTIRVCAKCGNIPHDPTFCQICHSDSIVEKIMPYATKLLFQELIGMGIKITIG